LSAAPRSADNCGERAGADETAGYLVVVSDGTVVLVDRELPIQIRVDEIFSTPRAC
jgi:hypothetical protein